jgi:ribosomal protein S6
MTDYELLYIVPTSLTEEEAGTVEQAVGGMLAKVNATVQSTKRLGKLST